MPELRYAIAPITHVDVRDSQANDDNTWTMSGYAAVFNEKTTIFDGKFVKLTEEIDSKAFDPVLREQPMGEPSGVVHFNFGHDMNRAVAATDVQAGQPGSLELTADKLGLRFLAKVPRDDPDGVAMAAKMRSGVLKQASFAFTIAKVETTSTESEDGPIEEHDRIMQIKRLYDVAAVSQGAYSQASSQLVRSYAATLLGQPSEQEGGQHRQSDLEGGNAVSRIPEIEKGIESGGEAKRNDSPLILETRRYMAEERKRLARVFGEDKEDGGSSRTED